MASDLIRLMNSLFLPAAQTLHQGCWHPPADIYRIQDGWLIKFDLAGVRPEDLEVSIAGSHLIVRGTRRDSCVDESCHCYSMEISYSQFERSVELPCDLELTHVASEYRDGMLLVRIHPEARA